ncbi:MAG TPA: TetR/AcrR family transcriptional regulator [Candidatus Binataceae bacterium]|nr:TetR/AcrR family transcriptional regulator [Candidatus Binataceae bacterium]
MKSVGRPSAKERKPYNMDAIVDVAVQVFLRHGYDGASLDQVAEAAGITKASIYYHAEGKEALLKHGAGRALDALFAVLEEPAAIEGRALDRLKHVVRRTVEITVKRLPEVALLLRVRGNTETERWILDRRRRFDRLVAKIVDEAQAKGELRADIEAGLITRLLFGMLNSITEWYRPGGGLNVDDVVAAATRIAFNGLE